MKKGCFLTIFITLVIIIIAVVYLIRFHGDEILDIGKDKVITLTEKELMKEITSIDVTEYKDSLQTLVKDYIKNLESLKPKEAIEKLDVLSSNIKVFLKDKKIDKDEFSFLKKFLEINAK